MKRLPAVAIVPLAVWAVAAYCLVVFAPTEPAAQHSTNGLNPEGFIATYDEHKGSWKWSYSKQMHDGCEKLLIPDSAAVQVDGKVVWIALKTYKSESACSLPARTSTAMGRISYDADAVFYLTLDGEPVL